MTRNGKIARLPRTVRDELNRRLQDGELGSKLVEWLNSKSDVQKTVAKEFGGRPVNEQNLSDWKQGGYQDWLRHEEARLLVSDLAEQAGELAEATEGAQISDRFASLLSVEFVMLVRRLLEVETDPKKKWEFVQEAGRELSRLRRDDHRGVRTTIKWERWKQEEERAKNDIF